MKIKLLISALIFLFGSMMMMLTGILLNNSGVVWTSVVILISTIITISFICIYHESN